MAGKAGFLDFDEHVPMVDKAVDSGWKKEVSHQKLPSPRGWQLNVCFTRDMKFLYISIIHIFYLVIACFLSLGNSLVDWERRHP